jgi:hypothetical protein
MPRSVLIATPTFSNYPSWEYCGALAQTSAFLVQAGVQPIIRFHPGLQFIEVARNIFCAELLQDKLDCTDLFFIDDDVGNWPPHKVLEFINRPEPVVGGVYPARSDEPKFHIKLRLVDGKVKEQHGLYCAAQLPAGFLRIKREVIEHFAAKSETYGWEQADGSIRTLFNIFDRGRLHGEFFGEDAMFSQRCLDDGIDMWVDPDIEFTHRGSKAWKGSFKPSLDSFLAQRSDLVQPAVAL